MCNRWSKDADNEWIVEGCLSSEEDKIGDIYEVN